MRRLVYLVGLGCVLAGIPATSSAQQRASIVGVVQDTTGAIMPGVTVEASSPALIEQVRAAITDSAGRFSIIDLRPGIYTVTFTLPGFRSVKREGIVLEGAFAAQVNGTLSVGAVEETVTVTGASPIVDTQSTQNQAVLNRQVLDVLPAARTMQGGAALVPGVSFYSQGFVSTMSIHGSATADQHIFFDGMNIGQNLTGTGSQANGVTVNELAQTELVYDAGSQSAENALGGVRMDSIPKEGGNTFSGAWRTVGSKGSLQGDNITDELKPYISVNTQLDYSYDTNFVLGGPIRKNKLWFLVAQRVSRTNNLVAFPVGVLPAFPNGTQVESGGFIVPHETVRLTWQASPRNKIVWAFYKSQAGTQRFDVGCGATSGNVAACFSPEASYALPQPLQYASQVKWTSPISSRVLLEVGQSLAVQTYNFSYQPENGPLDIQHRSATTGLRTVASSTAPSHYFSRIWNTIANVSFVTGSHNVKVGINQQMGYQTTQNEPHGDTSVLIYATSATGVNTSQTATRPQHAVHAAGEPEREPRALRAGQVDAAASDADLRRAVRLLQRLDAAAVSGGRPFHFGDRAGGARQHRAVELPAVLERLDDPQRRVVRPVRHRQDGAQGLGREIPRTAGARPRFVDQPAGRSERHARSGPTSIATARSSTPAATCSSTSWA